MKRVTELGIVSFIAILLVTPVDAEEPSTRSLELGPDGPGPVACIYCTPCADPRRMKTHNFPAEGDWILFINESCGTVYDCEDAIQCMAEDEQEQLAQLAEVIESQDVVALVDLVLAKPGWVEVLPDRGLLLARGGCGDGYTELHQLAGEQVDALLRIEAVVTAFQEE